MQHWRLSVVVLASVFLAAPAVSAAPILYSETEPGGIGDIAIEVAGLGSALTVGADTIMVGGRMDVSDVTGTFLNRDTFEALGSVVADRGMASNERRLASVTETDSGSIEVQLHESSDTDVDMVASIEVVPNNDRDRFGTEVALSDSHIAVLDAGEGQAPDAIVILEITEADEAVEITETLRIETGLAHLNLKFAGDLLAVSGVPSLGNVGHLVTYDVGTGQESDRIENIGGGPIATIDGAIFVQRNQYFVQPSGTWSMIDTAGNKLGNPVELPGNGASLDANDATILMGDPIRNQVLVFERTPEEPWPFRFTQSVRNENKNSSDQFGASVAILGETALIGAPGVTTEGFAFRGALGLYGFADGPIGCTVVGTPGDDEKLTGTGGRDTLCGLDGADRILGFAGDDVIYGGAGDDALLGTAGNDILYGDAGDDILNGGDDDDLLIGGDGNDTGNGGAGNDTFVGGPGRDKGNGGEGTNSCEAEQRFLC